MNFCRQHLSCIFFLGIIFLLPSAASSLTGDSFDPGQAVLTLKKIEDGFSKGEADLAQMESALQVAADLKDESDHCLGASQSELEQINESLEVIGPAVTGEAREITQKRNALQTRKTNLERDLAGCRLIDVRAGEVRTRITELRHQMLARQLFHKQDNIVALIAGSFKDGAKWQEAGKSFCLRKSWLGDLTPGMLIILTVPALIAMFFGLWFRRNVSRLALFSIEKILADRLIKAHIATIAHFAPYLLLTGGFALGNLFFLGIQDRPYLITVSFGLFFYLAAMTGIRILFSPAPPAKELLSWPPKLVRHLIHKLNILAVLGLSAFLLFYSRLETVLPTPAWQLAKTTLFTASSLVLLRLIGLLGLFPAFAGKERILKWLAMTGLLLSIVVDWLGYVNLAFFIFRGVLGSMAVVIFLRLLNYGLSSLIDNFSRCALPWQQHIQKKICLKPQEMNTSFILIRIVITILAWCLAGLFLLRLWGISESYFTTVKSWLLEGFSLGESRIVPLRILAGFLFFALLWTLGRGVKANMEKRWLVDTLLGPSSQDAVVTFTGYLGIIFALLVGLGVAGMDFTRFTIIAGALSVGIGFGLQNVVNNFVSGLILLFERPIKRGDWISVGGTEGYVERISVRSTVVRTFDGADVIVPNSEFISSQVTNWMLDDPRGRIRVPVGVAYGSDTALVKKLLLDIAGDHPQIIVDGSLPLPWVLFIEFGESSLNFELRCFIRNIDQRPLVSSELNFAIDAAFRKHKIAIPFPQREVRVLHD